MSGVSRCPECGAEAEVEAKLVYARQWLAMDHGTACAVMRGEGCDCGWSQGEPAGCEARAEKAEAEVAALRKRVADAPEAWIWTDHVCYSREEMDRLIGGRWGTEDVEHVRLVPEEAL